MDLGVSPEAAGLVTTMFLFGYCAGPLIWAPLSEFYGRVPLKCPGCSIPGIHDSISDMNI